MAVFSDKPPGPRLQARSGPRSRGAKGISETVNGAGSNNGAAYVGREHVSEIQRARLVAAMTEVAAEVGLANASVAQVIARAGVSRRTFYELYDDREECFLDALDAAIAQVSERVVSAYASGASWRDRIGGGLIALLIFLEENPDAGRILIVESLGAGPRSLERRNNVLARVIAAMDDGRGKAKPDMGPPPMTAEGTIGGVLSLLHSRFYTTECGDLLELTGSLMGMIVLPYLGAAAARRELDRPVPAHSAKVTTTPADPLRDLEMRLTYRTVRVLSAVASLGGQGSYPSNREVGKAAEIDDQGQISKLLTRLSKLGLIANTGAGQTRGAPNAWTLTEKGAEIEAAVGGRSG
jgi:AcrR family transcriptional regulator